MNRVRIILTLAFALAVLMSWGIMTASADQPNDSSVAQLAYLDGDTHTISPNSTQVFRFDYALKSDGSRPNVTIRMPGGTNSGLDFKVWSIDQLRDQMARAVDGPSSKLDQTIGRGSAANISCDTGVLSGNGACKTSDLAWTGTLGASGPYFVSVTNNSTSDKAYQLVIQSTGVNLAPQQNQQVAAATTQQNGPAAAPALTTTGNDPAQASAFDSQQHTIAAGNSTWFKFDYALKSDGSRPLITIRMPNAANGVGFRVWTADQLAARASNAADARLDNAHNQPIGVGSTQRMNCDTGVLTGSGACQTADVIWQGTFGSGGPYYVEVVNGGTGDAGYQLTMTQ